MAVMAHKAPAALALTRMAKCRCSSTATASSSTASSSPTTWTGSVPLAPAGPGFGRMPRRWRSFACGSRSSRACTRRCGPCSTGTRSARFFSPEDFSQRIVTASFLLGSTRATGNGGSTRSPTRSGSIPIRTSPPGSSSKKVAVVEARLAEAAFLLGDRPSFADLAWLTRVAALETLGLGVRGRKVPLPRPLARAPGKRDRNRPRRRLSRGGPVGSRSATRVSSYPRAWIGCGHASYVRKMRLRLRPVRERGELRG